MLRGFARFMSERTLARLAELAQQIVAVKGADDYLSMIDYDVRMPAAACPGRG